MLNDILLYIGSGIILLWGLSHVIVTRSVVAGYGDTSADNRHIITMEWLDEGLALIFLGVLPLLYTLIEGTAVPGAPLVYLACAGMLLVLAIVSLFTGAKTSIVPIKICPLVKISVAVLFILGSLL